MSLRLRNTAVFRVERGPTVLQAPVLTRTSIFTGSAGDFLARLDKRTGKQIWRKRKSGSVLSSHGDAVLVYSAREMQLWDEGGEILWKRHGNEVAINDRLYFNGDGRLKIVDVLTGKIVDEFDCPPGRSDLMHDGVLLLKHPDGTTDPVQAIDLAARTRLWQKFFLPEILERHRDSGRRGLSFVASHPGQVVASSGEHLFGISLADGNVRWTCPVTAPYLPHVDRGRLFLWTTAAAAPSTTVTVDLGAGQVSRQAVAPATGENRFVIVDEPTGKILLDRPLATYGEPFQRFQAVRRGARCTNHIVFTTASGLMVVFRLSDGELVWQHQHADELFSVVCEANRLYVTCADGSIVVFEADGGDL